MIPLLSIWNSFPVLPEKICFFGEKFYICLRFEKNLRGRLHRLHGYFPLPPFAPDARLKYHCALYESSPDRVQSRSSQPGFSLACRGRVLAYRCAGSAYRECTQVFGYSVVKVQESAFHLSIGHFSKSFKMLFADRRKCPLTYKDKKGVKINLFLEKTKRKNFFVGTTKYCILKLCRITTKKAKEKAAKCNTGLYKNERRISEYPCSIF